MNSPVHNMYHLICVLIFVDFLYVALRGVYKVVPNFMHKTLIAVTSS